MKSKKLLTSFTKYCEKYPAGIREINARQERYDEDPEAYEAEQQAMAEQAEMEAQAEYEDKCRAEDEYQMQQDEEFDYNNQC